MPSYNYRDSQLKRLRDPEYASLYIEASFSEALKDGYVGGFLIALGNVVEAASHRQNKVAEVDVLRKRLYQNLSNYESPNTEIIIAELEAVGLTAEIKPVSAQVPS